MRTLAIGCLTTALLASLAFGQTPAAPGVDRVFYFTHTDNPQNLQEIANIVRAMNDSTATLDRTKKTLAVHGTSAQIALVEWIMSEMDKPAGTPPSPVPAIHPNGNDRGVDQVVRVFSLTHAETPLNLQQLTNLLRSLTNMQRVFPYNALKLLVASGSADQMALADWLVQQLDRPPGPPVQDPGTRDLRWTFKIMHTVRVFYLTHDQSPQEIQGIISQLRSATKVDHIAPYSAQHAIAVAGTADQMAAVARLVKELDQAPLR